MITSAIDAKKLKGIAVTVLLGCAMFLGLEHMFGNGIDAESFKNMVIAGIFCGLSGLLS